MGASSLQRSLARGTSAFLDYHFACDRGGLFSEKYLSEPVGCILKSRPGVARVAAEVNHPGFRNPARGRPCQIDFVSYSDVDLRCPVIAVEAKWFGRSMLTGVEWLWDVYRLALWSCHYPDCICLLIAAGVSNRCPGAKRAAGLIRHDSASYPNILAKAGNERWDAIQGRLDARQQVPSQQIKSISVGVPTLGTTSESGLSWQTMVWRVRGVTL